MVVFNDSLSLLENKNKPGNLHLRTIVHTIQYFDSDDVWNNFWYWKIDYQDL